MSGSESRIADTIPTTTPSVATPLPTIPFTSPLAPRPRKLLVPPGSYPFPSSKLAPPPFRRTGRPHHFSSLVRYLFPRVVREIYRERLIAFHLDVVPHYKHRVQSRIYRFLVDRHVRRKDQARIVDIVRNSSRRLFLGPTKPVPKDARNVATTDKKMPMPNYESGGGGGRGAAYGSPGGPAGISGDDGIDPYTGRERGARRKKFAAMAGTLLSSGRAAVTEIKESYNQGRSRGLDFSEGHHTNIPGAFPDVNIAVYGEEQMVVFPSYAKTHVREFHPDLTPPAPSSDINERDYWQDEFRRMEDQNAIVDVDVRGWVYSPHKGPMTRKNRMLIGLARQLSGIPAPRPPASAGYSPTEDSTSAFNEAQELRREQDRIATRAKEIERLGQSEKEVATRGGYSEKPADDLNDPEFDTPRAVRDRGGSETPSSTPGSPSLAPIKSVASASAELSEAELAIANANLMSRLGPFLTTPLVSAPVTMFFYNDTESQKRMVETNDAGHFSFRAPLSFVPTHVRVIGNETLSTIQPVQIIDTKGVSLISDIDDTIKKSNISLGVKEIFRNTFARDLSDLTINGVSDWYNGLYNMGVHMHYCSNSPWQLFPVLASFFKLAGLPDGSIHLKHYPGMLQGVFEPVAERKKPTLEKIMRDFPNRKFLLVGDSGEADLEVYTELALANPNRILAVFIRDVTTPEKAGFFDPGYDPSFEKRVPEPSARSSLTDISNGTPTRPVLPPRPSGLSERGSVSKPVVPNLIDFSDEVNTTPPPINRKPVPAQTIYTTKPAPPPRPAKPVALRSSSFALSAEAKANAALDTRGFPKPPLPPPPLPRATQLFESTPKGTVHSRPEKFSLSKGPPPPPPPPRRRGTPSAPTLSASPRFTTGRRSRSNSDLVDIPPLSPGTASPDPRGSFGQNSCMGGRPVTPMEPYNKKLDMWNRRLERAHETLEVAGVKLYTWRRGGDVMKEAEGIVRETLEKMGLWR